MEELVKVGAGLLRAGWDVEGDAADIHPGDLGVIQAAIRDEGTTLHYLPVEFPAVADLDVTRALAVELEARAEPCTSESLAVEGLLLRSARARAHAVAHRLAERWSAWMAGGAICSEMEAAALYIVASTLRVRAGGIMMILGHRYNGHWDMAEMTDDEIERGSVDSLLPAAIAGMRGVLRDREAAAA